MKTAAYRHVFGPVPSRRLGRSLGVDVVPFKTCSYDCIYCQLGRTTNKTICRSEYTPTERILDEVKRKLADDSQPDYITFSGSGEPTLHSSLGRLIEAIKEITTVPVAVLTNGSLLYDKQVQNDVRGADLVIPSLDVSDEIEFQRVNRPFVDVTFDKMVRGLIDFRTKYTGAIWLEVMLLRGVTDNESSVGKLVSFTEKINPEKIQLNTVARPPAEEYALAVSQEKMHCFAGMFGGKAEVIADFNPAMNSRSFSISRNEVYNLIKRRPCSLKDIAAGLSIHRNEAVKHTQHLLTEGLITIESIKSTRYYKAL